MSTQAEHTPGPWKVDDSPIVVEGMGAFAVISSENLRPEGHIIVAGVVDISTEVWPQCGSAEANARLIAAAPDLLAACEAQLAHLSTTFPPYSPGESPMDKTRAAVAKARSTP